MVAKGVRLNVIGEINRLPAEVRKVLEDTIEQTAANEAMVLTLALSYGARNEVTRAVRHLATEAQSGRIDPAAIDESTLDQALDTRNLPDPDFLIRTSGEMRISNFLLWQLAYAELYFTEALWPDFDVQELHRALREYGLRQRRFGLTGAQVEGQDMRPSGEGCH
jgi:undecaprenyl diphosphate synthase